MATHFHLANGGIIDFDSSNLTLTHNSNGLRLNSTKRLEFNSDTSYIASSGAGALALVGATTFTGTSTFNGSVTFGGNIVAGVAGEAKSIFDTTTNTITVGSSTGTLTVPGALTVTGATTIGAAGGNNNFIVAGTTNSNTLEWDSGTNVLSLDGSSSLTVGGTSTLIGATTIGVTDQGSNAVDFKIFGTVAANYLEWDASADTLKLEGTSKLTVRGATTIGTAGGTNNFKVFGTVAANYLEWDSGTNALLLEGASSLTVDGNVTLNGNTYVFPSTSDTPTTGQVLKATNSSSPYTLEWAAESGGSGSSLNDLTDVLTSEGIADNKFNKSILIFTDEEGGTLPLLTNVSTASIDNIIIGDAAFTGLISASQNIILGNSSAATITTGSNNVVIGDTSAATITTGSNNVAIGDTSASNIVNSNNNVVIGNSSATAMINGNNNVILGDNAATQITVEYSGTLSSAGSSGTQFTLEDGKSTQDDFYNGYTITFTNGSNSGESKTILSYSGSTRLVTLSSSLGSTPSASDEYNIKAGSSLIHASQNTLLGCKSTCSSTFYSGALSADGVGGSQFTLETAASTTTGIYNYYTITFTDGNNSNESRIITDYTVTGSVGSELRTVTVDSTFSNSPISGDAYIISANNQTSLGYLSVCSAANQVTLGNNSVTALRAAESTIATLSDSRDKTNVSNSTYGLDFVNTLRPVQYTWNRRNLEFGDSTSVHNGKTRVGFLAQELQSAMPNNENEILDLVYDVNPKRLEVKYGNLIPILSKAIQDLSAANTALAARVSALENA